MYFITERLKHTRIEKKNIRGAQSTADVSLSGLGRFCNMAAPHEVANMSEKQIVGLMLDYVTTLEKNGKTGSIH